MTGPYDPPSDPSPTHPLINEAFGWDTSSEVPPSVQLGVSQAQDTLANLRSTLNNHITQTWANAAVTADTLAGKLAYHIDGQLRNVQDTLAALHQPIAMQVVGPLSQAIERSIPLGLVPPMPGAEPSTPPCVLIAQGAAAGDITPAIEAYRALAFAQRFTRGPQYVDAVNYITQCLPVQGGTREQFAAMVLQLQNQPDVLPLQDIPGGGTVPPSSAAQPEMTLGSGAPPGFQTTLPAVPVGVPVREILPVSGPAPTGPVAGSSGLPGGFGTLPVPGGGVPGLPVPGASPGGVPAPPPGYVYSPGGNVLVPIGGPVTAVPPGYIPGSGPGPTPGFTGGPVQGGSGALPTVPGGSSGFIPGSGAAPIGMGPIPGPTPPGPGGVIYQPPGGVPPGYIPGSGPPPGYTTPSPQPTSPPPPGGTVLPSPRPEMPPTKPAPAPCIKICPPDQPPPKKCDYTAYCSSVTHTLYVVRTDQPARNPSDRLIVSGDPTEWDWLQLQNICGAPAPVPPGGGGGAANVAPFAGGCADFPPTPVARGINVGEQFLHWLGFVDDFGNVTKPFPDAGVTDIGENLLNGLAGIINQQLKGILEALGAFLSQTPCADGDQLGLIATAELIGTIEKWLGWDLSQLRIPNAYQRQFRCPVRLPAITEAATAWLGNEIDDATLQCWVQANNGKFKEFATMIRAARTKLSPLQYGALFMRDKIGRQDFNDRIRETGMIRPQDQQDVLDLLKQLPPPGDIVRFMVRDAADESLVDEFGLDESFTDKFTGRVEEWARQQGIDPQYMQYLWRSHWQIPAPQQLAEMWHRLSRLNPGDPAYVGEDTVRRALQQQDIAPFWIAKFLAISFRPLTRIDARRAYENGALDDPGLINAYLDLGYNQTNAETLLEFNKTLRRIKFSKSPHVTEYAKGAINGAQLDAALTIEGAPPDVIQFVHDQLPVAMDKLRRSRCLKALQRQYLLGELDQATTSTSILAQGLDADQADSILRGWTCEKDARGKAIPAGELCTMFAQGALTIPQLVERLQRIGYSYDDAVLMARRCATTTQQKMTKAEQQQLKAQQAADEKEARQLARAAKATAAAIARGQRLAQKAADMRVMREKRLIEAGEKFSKHFAGSLSDAIIAVKATYNQFEKQGLWLQDEIVNALVVVTGSREVFDIPTLTTAVQTALAV